MRLTYLQSEQLTDDIWSFRFKPEKPLRFIAGQYIEITLPHGPMDNRGDRRWMTITTAPSDAEIEIMMRFAPKNGSSYKTAFKTMPPGTVLHASEPIGDFVLPKSPEIPATFIAAGIGITPVLSIVRDLQKRQSDHPLQLIYSARTPKDLIGHDIFTDSHIRYTPIISQPSTEWKGQTGRLSGKRILELSHPQPGQLYFLSGPEQLVLGIIDELYTHGIERSQIVMDYFPGYNFLY